MQKSVQVCRRIFGGMLSFARGGARRSHHGEVSPALETTLAVLKDGMQRRGIDLVVETADDLPPVACGQSDLEQVFLNLLTNAREASSQGGEVTVRVQPEPERIAITIADSGCGIAPEDLPRVFEPFFTTKPNGNGLGLSICRSILWEVGGTLSVQSELRKGTRVLVTVPWAPSTYVARRTMKRPARILVVDDEFGHGSRRRARPRRHARRRRQPLVAGGARPRPPVRPRTWSSST